MAQNKAQEALDEAHMAYLNILLESGCKIVNKTVIAGKEYVWMKDKFGTHFLERLPETRDKV